MTSLLDLILSCNYKTISMNASSFIKLGLIFVISTLILSCSKEKKQDQEAEPTYEELLVAHPWNGIEVTRYVNGNADRTNAITGLKYVFTDDYKYKKFDHNNLIQTGTWEIVTASSISFVRTRYFDPNLNSNILDDLQIIQLTSDIFEYAMPYIDNSGDTKRDQYKYGR